MAAKKTPAATTAPALSEAAEPTGPAPEPQHDAAAAAFEQLAEAAVTPPPAAVADEDAQAAYEVISPLEHDLKPFAIGSTVHLTAKQAAPLLGHTIKLIA